MAINKDEIQELLNSVDAFIAGGKSQENIDLAERKLELKFPPTFREYLLEWGNLSFDYYEYYGLTEETDFENSGIPDCIWFTLKKRMEVGLPKNLVIFRNDNGELYHCVLATDSTSAQEKIVIWDNIEKTIDESYEMTFFEYLSSNLQEHREELE